MISSSDVCWLAWTARSILTTARLWSRTSPSRRFTSASRTVAELGILLLDWTSWIYLRAASSANFKSSWTSSLLTSIALRRIRILLILTLGVWLSRLVNSKLLVLSTLTFSRSFWPEGCNEELSWSKRKGNFTRWSTWKRPTRRSTKWLKLSTIGCFRGQISWWYP